ncbi:MAG: hypothetical protein E7379_03440 [Clostridiales bacterium]|nr:hypothetical protein [Clostridiales bacterium]
MILPTWLVLCVGVLCYFALPIAIWCIRKDRVRNILTIVFFCMYLIVLFCGVFGSLAISENQIIVDFDFGGQWCSKTIKWSLSHIATFDLVINLLMLIPVGMMIYYFARKKQWWAKLLILIGFGLLTGLLIETCQFVLPIPRSVQLSDVLLNCLSVTVGGLIAWGYLAIIKKIRKY